MLLADYRAESIDKHFLLTLKLRSPTMTKIVFARGCNKAQLATTPI